MSPPMVDGTTNQVADDGSRGRPTLLFRFRAIAEGVGVIVAPVTLITCLLYYFGLVRTSAFYMFFGVDYSVLGFGPADYLIRSIDAMFLPLGLLAIAGIAALQCHRVALALIHARPDSPLVRIGLSGLAVGGFILMIIGALGLSRQPLLPAPILGPISLVLGAALFVYRTSLGKVTERQQPINAVLPSMSPMQRALFLACGTLLLTAGSFWGIADYAELIGNARAEQTVHELPKRPSIVVYSSKRLAISSPGIREEQLAGSASAYTYRYSGLKLLLHSGGRYFLLPARWSDSNRITVVIPDDVGMRFDAVPAP